MAVYKIVTLGEPGDGILREKALPVKSITKHILKLLDDLAETMYAAKGVGLAAPQIGVAKRVIVVDVGEGLWELINPEVVSRSGESVEVEGCLSIPGVAGEVRRAARVVVRGWNRKGETVTVAAEKLGARALQHEIDHLDGILFVDKVLRYV